VTGHDVRYLELNPLISNYKDIKKSGCWLLVTGYWLGDGLWAMGYGQV